MKISSLQLEAFFETAKFRSFSRAADSLGLTQSALSQRVSKLEAELELGLFIRDPAGPILTAAGETLLRHCQVSSSLEQEVLGQLKSSADEFRGSIRIAGFSSTLRSVIIPSLADFLRLHPQVQCDFQSHEVNKLARVLRNAEADYIVLDYPLQKKGIIEIPLGREEYVVIESVKHQVPEGVYLDHSPEDAATEIFFQSQIQSLFPKNFTRSFLGDVYGILAGTELGLGRSVMSKHLLKGNAKVRIVKGYKPYHRNISLSYFEQPYYSRLHYEVVRQLTKNSGNYLQGPGN